MTADTPTPTPTTPDSAAGDLSADLPAVADIGCIILPYHHQLEHTLRALADASAQRPLVPDLDRAPRIILLNNGGPVDSLTSLPPSPQVLRWHAALPFPSLAAAWNTMLDLAWSLGHQDALVINNDIRMAPEMYATLRRLAHQYGLWIATPVNIRDSAHPGRWQTTDLTAAADVLEAGGGSPAFGGPDFSCFLIRRECHQRVRFDERFRPAYHEDNDYTRRLWLAGFGPRIAGLPLPYWHLGSATINRTPEVAAAFASKFAACQQRYIEKWGGLPHQETKLTPDSEESIPGVGTPGGYLAGDFPQRTDAGLEWLPPAPLGVARG